MNDGWKYLPEYGISVRPDGAVKTSRKGVHFGNTESTGYQQVWTKDGPKKVHRLVMEAFIGASNLEVNHKNGIRTDNRLGNLEYCTSAQNQRDRYRRNGAQGCYKKQEGKWMAYIDIARRKRFLGYYATEKEAHSAYMDALDGISESV